MRSSTGPGYSSDPLATTRQHTKNQSGAVCTVHKARSSHRVRHTAQCSHSQPAAHAGWAKQRSSLAITSNNQDLKSYPGPSTRCCCVIIVPPKSTVHALRPTRCTTAATTAPEHHSRHLSPPQQSNSAFWPNCEPSRSAAARRRHIPWITVLTTLMYQSTLQTPELKTQTVIKVIKLRVQPLR